MNTTPTTLNTTVEDLSDDEIQSLNDAQFHEELTQFVSELPTPTEESNQRYNALMDLLNQIHNEVFPKPAEPEWEHNEMFDSSYYHEYSVGS
jgi:DNA polymerase sigma